jgi:Flp pilus assembly pilin Flp
MKGRKEMEAKATVIENGNGQRKQEKGVTTVEYAVMLVLVAIAVLAFGSGFSGSVTGVFSQLVSAL